MEGDVERPTARRKRWHNTTVLAIRLTSLFWLLGRTGALYVPESHFRERKITSKELCQDQKVEFNDDDSGHVWPSHQVTLYRRSLNNQQIPHARRRLAQNDGTSRHLSDAYDRIYGRDITASASMLERSLGNMGDTTRLRRAVRKLIRGHAIRIVAIGGSVTLGHGVESERNSYVNQFFDWIRHAFPNPKHELLNQAVPAVTSSYLCPCVLDMVPANTDLILLEFTINDSERDARMLEDPIPRSFERMLRKLLRLQPQPAIVYLHYWAGKRLKHEFAETVEDTYNLLLKYYGLMGISMRDAVHQLYMQDEAAIAEMFHPAWDADDVHPSCVGSRYLADLLIGHFQDLAAAELLTNGTASVTSNHDSRRKRLAAADIGPPLQANNSADLFEACVLQPESVKQLVRPQKGFEWVDEGKRSPKWGFVGRAPGDHLEIDVPVHDRKQQLTIGIGFLVSYEHMGQAALECVAGCSCRRREYSFIHPYSISITGWRIVEARREPDAKACTIRVSILKRTSSDPPEHKVKVTAVMISEEAEFQMPWLFCDECTT